MPTKPNRKKVTVVHEHPRHVPVSPKNPSGTTIVDEHLRRVAGSYLDSDEITKVVKNYNKKNIIYPTAKKLAEYPNADKYDEIIAIWTDYFNKKFNVLSPLDPDVIKALIGSESSFDEDPKGNKIAFGITQITKETLKVLQDPKGETKDFIFKKIRQKDLKNPEIAIPMTVRWLFRKNETAMNKLKRAPDREELILEYKGMLKSKSDLKKRALTNFRKKYAQLKSK